MTANDEPVKRPRGRPRKPPPENPPPKRPVGRPSIGDAAKVQNVTIRLAPEEYREWKRMAEEQGLSLSAFITGPLRKILSAKGKKT